MIQASLLQLDDYGPWTTTPHPRREMDLQTLQSRLYADIAAYVGDREGYAFYTRGDNIVAFTNNLDESAHGRLQTSIGNRYPVTVSVGIGKGETPKQALRVATEHLQSTGSAQSGNRTEVLEGESVAAPDQMDVAHFDVIDATGEYTDSETAYDAYLDITAGTDVLARHLYREHAALTFFVGGDNAIAIAPPLEQSTYDGVLEFVREQSGVDLRVGIGRGRTAQTAGVEAKEALETGRDAERKTVIACRESGTTTE